MVGVCVCVCVLCQSVEPVLPEEEDEGESLSNILHNNSRPRAAPRHQEIKSWIRKEVNVAADFFQAQVPRTRCSSQSSGPETESVEGHKGTSRCSVVAEEKEEERQ